MKARNLPQRITNYLATGGLWSPELADHDEVRGMLIDARDVIEILLREREVLGYERQQWQARSEHLAKTLTSIHLRLPPPNIVLEDGREMQFNDAHAMQTLRQLQEIVARIPEMRGPHNTVRVENLADSETEGGK